MASKKLDFSQEELVTDLPQPIHHKNQKGGESVVVRKVKIQRLYGPDLSRLKQSLQSLQIQTYGGNALLIAAREILKLGIVEFQDGKGKEVDSVTVPALINRLSPANVYKLMVFIMMLTRETAYITTSYRCGSQECGRTIICDLNPEVPIPKDTEVERVLQQNFMEMYREKINTRAVPTFTYKLKEPYKVDNWAWTDGGENLDDNEKPIPEKITVYSLEFEWPVLASYVSAAKDDKKRDDVDLWALYDSIVKVNDSIEGHDLTELKGKNGCARLLRMKAADMNGLTDALDTYGMIIDNIVECPHCGYVNKDVPFDFTNFFDFLRN